MKKIIALICIVATPGFLFSAEKPDGTLGTNLVSVSGLYSNLDYGYYISGQDFDYAGIGIQINQKLTKTKDYGIDLFLSYSYMSNQNNTDVYSLDSRQFLVGATIYREGMISPFFRPVVGYINETYDDGGVSDDDFNCWIYGAEAGFELHLVRGLSLTPAIAYLNSSEDEMSSETIFTLDLNYWFNERLGMIGSVNYSSQEHIDSAGLSLGMALHY